MYKNLSAVSRILLSHHKDETAIIYLAPASLQGS